MSNYWTNRQTQALNEITSKSIKEINEQLQRYYGRAAKKLIKEFELTYNKLLATVGADKPITPADLYKLDKYWQMQGQLQKELQKLGNQQIVLLQNKFFNQFNEIYRAIALNSDLAFGTIDNAMVNQMITSIWCADGKSWSDRVWNNTNLLQQTLNDGLIDCVVTGKKPSQLKAILQDRFNVAYSNADMIVRTETAHIQTQAAQQRYKDYGIQEVEIYVDEDERTCPICSKLEGKRYPIHGVMPVPIHPRCRCCIIPVVE